MRLWDRVKQSFGNLLHDLFLPKESGALGVGWSMRAMWIMDGSGFDLADQGFLDYRAEPCYLSYYPVCTLRQKIFGSRRNWSTCSAVKGGCILQRLRDISQYLGWISGYRNSSKMKELNGKTLKTSEYLFNDNLASKQQCVLVCHVSSFSWWQEVWGTVRGHLCPD